MYFRENAHGYTHNFALWFSSVSLDDIVAATVARQDHARFKNKRLCRENDSCFRELCSLSSGRKIIAQWRSVHVNTPLCVCARVCVCVYKRYTLSTFAVGLLNNLFKLFNISSLTNVIIYVIISIFVNIKSQNSNTKRTLKVRIFINEYCNKIEKTFFLLTSLFIYQPKRENVSFWSLSYSLSLFPL